MTQLEVNNNATRGNENTTRGELQHNERWIATLDPPVQTKEYDSWKLVNGEPDAWVLPSRQFDESRPIEGHQKVLQWYSQIVVRCPEFTRDIPKVRKPSAGAASASSGGVTAAAKQGGAGKAKAKSGVGASPAAIAAPQARKKHAAVRAAPGRKTTSIAR